MKFKIKVKTLIAFILAALFIILIITPLINLEIANHLSNNNKSDKADAFYQNYINSPIKINKREGLYEYAGSLVKGFEKYKIKLNGWGGGENTTPEDMERAIEIFEEVLLTGDKKDYNDKYSLFSYSKLLDTSIATLDTDKLLYWIEWGRDKENKEIKYNSRLYQAYYYFVQRDYESSKVILDSLDEKDLDRKYYLLMGDVNLHLGDREEAQKWYKKLEDSNYDINYNSYDSSFGGESSYIGEHEIKEYLDRLGEGYTIKGKISNNGKGLAFIEIYLNEDIGVFSTGATIPDAITDENGEFETLPVKQGVYDIGIGLNTSQLYNKVFLRKDISLLELEGDIEFNFDFVSPFKIKAPRESIVMKEEEYLNISWDQIEGAEYYKVETVIFMNYKEKSGGSVTMPISDKVGEEKIEDNKIIFRLSDSNKSIGIMSYQGDEEIINPTAIIGAFIPGGEHPIIVSAYDKDDNLLSSSLPLISNYEDMVSIEVEGELSEGEKLIMENKYEEAISLYESKLLEDPKDEKSLFYLARIYGLGWKKGAQDITKAIEYARVYDKEYGDYNLVFELFDFMGTKTMRDNKDLVKEVLNLVDEKDRDEDYYYNEARYYLIEEDYLAAKSSYRNIVKDRNINEAYIDMYLEDYSRAIDSLENGEMKVMFMNKRIVNEALKDIDSVSNKDKLLFKDLLKTILDNNLSTKEMNILYKNTLKKMDSKDLKDAVTEIAKEEYFYEYYDEGVYEVDEDNNNE